MLVDKTLKDRDGLEMEMKQKGKKDIEGERCRDEAQLYVGRQAGIQAIRGRIGKVGR